MKIFTFENPDSQVRACSSAGGLFTVLAEHTFACRGAVYGVAFGTDWSIEHRRIDNADGLHGLRGSKYAFTDISRCFGQILKDIETGRKVLVVGTPCQIAAVRKRFPQTKGMLLVEVVCHGAPQPKYWHMYLDEVLATQGKTREDIATINFRDKSLGWKNYSVRIDFNDGSSFAQNHRDNLYILAFVYDYTLRTGCSKCGFKHPNSKADISMGDFWGIESLAPDIDNNLGTTIAIANTALGENILSDISQATDLTIDDVARFNPAIVKMPNTPSHKPEFEALASTEGFHAAARKYLQPVFAARNQKPTLKTHLRTLLHRVYSFLRNR